MSFGDLIYAGIIGCSAYLQAERGGWALVILSLLLYAMGFGGLVSWMEPGVSAAELMNGPERLRVLAILMLATGLGYVAWGAMAGKILAWGLAPGRAGVTAFVAGYGVILFFGTHACLSLLRIF